jgi:hypothetical protein
MNKNDDVAFKRSKKSPEGKMMVDALEARKKASDELSIEENADPSTIRLSVKGLKAIETLVESLDFALGENILSFRLIYRLPSRTYRTEFILNGITTIKPNTYNGASTGMGYWKLLKASLKGKI